jgi:thioredoxin 1
MELLKESVMENAIEISDSSFDSEVIKSDIPVLIDFWAVWCGPCRMISPFVEQIATEYSGKIKVGKIDIDQYKQVATRYGIRSIPTLLLFKGGQVVEQINGAVSKSQLVSKIEPHL